MGKRKKISKRLNDVAATLTQISACLAALESRKRRSRRKPPVEGSNRQHIADSPPDPTRVIWWQAREIAATDSLLRAVFFFAKALRDSRSVGAWLMFLSAFERARGLAPASPETVAKPVGNYVWPRGNGVD